MRVESRAFGLACQLLTTELKLPPATTPHLIQTQLHVVLLRFSMITTSHYHTAQIYIVLLGWVKAPIIISIIIITLSAFCNFRLVNAGGAEGKRWSSVHSN